MYLFSEMEVKSVPTEVFGSLKNEEEEDWTEYYNICH